MKPANLKHLLIAAAATLAVSQIAHAYNGQPLAHEAKLSIAKARATALHAFPGKIVSEELEREQGGSGLRYSFDIRHDGVIQEVGVDARTGKVLENAPEGPNPD